MFRRLRAAYEQVRQNSADRALRESCMSLLSERGEVSSVKYARAVIAQYRRLGNEERISFFAMLEHEFAPDPANVVTKAQRFVESGSAESLAALLRASEPPRQELLRRINRAPDGTATVLDMRSEVLQAMKLNPQLASVEADLYHLLSSWFNLGFMRLERIDWGSPAKLLERIIACEAVHQIQGWDDLRRRLEPDRRCFAFFHPALPEDPLIFVEVALTHDIPAEIAPLLTGKVDLDPANARCAVFYSISNCQPGLRGVSLGRFLITLVCEVLKNEFPRLRHFCTLSPMPGFARWLQHGAQCGAALLLPGAPARVEQSLGRIRPLLGEGAGSTAAALENATPTQREALLRLGAAYLWAMREKDAAMDPVAKFHLANGARVERLNFLANATPRGLRESHGLMVNYVYDLRDIERNHQSFVRGQITAARNITALL